MKTQFHDISRIFMTLPQCYCENCHFLPPSPRLRHVRNGCLKSAPFSESEMFIKPFGLRRLIKHELLVYILSADSLISTISVESYSSNDIASCRGLYFSNFYIWCVSSKSDIITRRADNPIDRGQEDPTSEELA